MKVDVTADDANNQDVVTINLLKPEGYEGNLFNKERVAERRNGRKLKIVINGLTRDYNDKWEEEYKIF